MRFIGKIIKEQQNVERRHFEISGLVQGVGFRPFLYNLAREKGLTGWVRNNFAGVELEVQGDTGALDSFGSELKQRAPVTAVIDEMRITTVEVVPEEQFNILTSEFGQLWGSPIPDQGICDNCRNEFNDNHDRRHHYPFISCAVCGPRFTIIEGLPFDRTRTTMTRFELCPDCRAEYTNPEDRRFHAQTIACAVCGPKLWFTDPAGNPLPVDPMVAVSHILSKGGIIGVKGIGGYHLACDAFSGTAVARLRQLKGRDNRAFAVMFKDLDEVKRHCQVGETEERVLLSLARPIVLLPKRSDSILAREINPGLKEIGAFLPYTGIQLLLFSESVPALVMTSGNRSGEPLSMDEAGAVRDLGPMVDGFLTHDRDIKWRADDSVLRVQHDRPIGIRRSRGFAPAPLKPGGRLIPLLACGAQQKNVFALTKGDQVYLSPHMGDLDNLASYLGYQEAVAQFRELLKCHPEWVVHDLHPDYNSTIYARGLGMPTLGIQHHLAHIGAAVAERQAKGPVIGVAFDGSGLGPDGKLWGGEFFYGEGCHWQRAGHLVYYPLPGGETAVKEPWRMAATYLEALYPEKLEEWLASYGLTAQWSFVSKALQLGINAPLTSSIGRLFDGVAALAGGPSRVSYEGEAAIWLENQADPQAPGSYEFQIKQGSKGFIIGMDSLPAAILNDMNRESPGVVSMKFHRGLARMIGEVITAIHGQTGIKQVILSGGVFQNRLLLELAWTQLEEAGFTVLVPELVPGNDGGIALGQAWLGSLMIEQGITDGLKW
jgi:hydrogenase maturation protein HypF